MGKSKKSKKSKKGQRSEPKVKSVSCDYCDLLFETNWKMRRHVNRKHLNIEKHYCPECPDIYDNTHDFYHHMRQQHKMGHVCGVCNMSFPRQKMRAAHEKEVHNLVRAQPKSEKQIREEKAAAEAAAAIPPLPFMIPPGMPPFMPPFPIPGVVPPVAAASSSTTPAMPPFMPPFPIPGVVPPVAAASSSTTPAIPPMPFPFMPPFGMPPFMPPFGMPGAVPPVATTVSATPAIPAFPPFASAAQSLPGVSNPYASSLYTSSTYPATATNTITVSSSYNTVPPKPARKSRFDQGSNAAPAKSYEAYALPVEAAPPTFKPPVAAPYYPDRESAMYPPRSSKSSHLSNPYEYEQQVLLSLSPPPGSSHASHSSSHRYHPYS